MYVSKRQKFWEKKNGGKSQDALRSKRHPLTMLEDNTPDFPKNEYSVVIDGDFFQKYIEIKRLIKEHRLSLINSDLGKDGYVLNFRKKEHAALFKMFWYQNV